MLGDISGLEKLYIVCGYTDMRKSIDGLCAVLEAAAMQGSFWKATADIWKRTAIRDITICRGSGAAPAGHISAGT